MIRRGTTWHLKLHVPVRYASIEKRQIVYMSLKTDDEAIARLKERQVRQTLEDGWEAALTGQTENAVERFQAARDLARARGFRFLPPERVAQLPVAEIVQRVQTIPDVPLGGSTPPVEVQAALGAVPPVPTLREALEEFFQRSRDQLIGKSEDQIAKWKAPRIKAVNNFIKIAGNHRLDEYTNDDLLDFREWWMERVLTAGYAPGSANKDLGYLALIIKTITRLHRIDIRIGFDGMRLREGTPNTRAPVSDDWILTVLLSDKMAGLNAQARDILITMVNTGARPSEIAALTAEQIHLNTNVPYIAIRPVTRQVKTKNSIRDLPLLGVSLEAMRRNPEGFPRYRSSPDSFSAAANKYIRENKLWEKHPSGKKLTVYGLRHNFRDRMTAAEFPELVAKQVFGHARSDQVYGDGAGLGHMAELIARVAF